MWMSAGAAIVLVPALSSGQAKEFRFTPYVGVFVPAAKLAQVNQTVAGTSFGGTLEHKTGFAIGATGSYWMTDRIGFEVGGAYALSDGRAAMTVNDESQGITDISAGENARVIFGAAKLMFGILPIGEDAQLRLGVGPAIVNRGGDAFKLQSDAEGKFTGLTNVGGAVSLCTRIPLTRLLAVRLRAEDVMYQSHLKFKSNSGPDESFDFDKKFQNDFILSAGLQIGFRR
jgi:hypothetical protein